MLEIILKHTFYASAPPTIGGERNYVSGSSVQSVRPFFLPISRDVISLYSEELAMKLGTIFIMWRTLLKRFSRSEVKGHGHFCGGGIGFDDVAYRLTCG